MRLVVGVVGVVICIAGAVISLDQFLRGYLIAFMFWLGLSLGCLALLMVQYLSGGFWGLSIRACWRLRQVPAADVRAVSADPVFREHLYAWMTDPSLTEHNGWYLHSGGLGGWFARWIIYFAIWIGLMLRPEPAAATCMTARCRASSRASRALSGLGCVLYSLTVSFAAVDWVMSLDPHWGSTIYGLIFIAGQGSVGAGFLRDHADVADALQPLSRNHQADAVS